MTHQAELEVWRQMPPEQRRRLITRLSQLATRQLRESQDVKVGNNDGPAMCAAQRQDSEHAPRPLGGGVCSAVDVAASGPSSGIDSIAIRVGGACLESGVVAVAGAGD